ncbi:MAG TPA: AAA family ATPase [Anaerolineae bacterium]|nr:AAA family ATPase [Anaerolineae bacterium]
MIEHTFVAREGELAHLDNLLKLSIQGHGQICFIAGEAGAGKTALLSAFASRALSKHHDLVIAVGTCNSHTGISDPYLPFREILAMLTGDIEGQLGQRIPSSENTTRLKSFLRISGQAIVELGPDLLDIFVPGSGIITRAGAFLAEKVGWLKKLEIIEKQKKASPTRPQKDPSRIVEQYSGVIQAMATNQPLIIAIDDLQWSDPSSLDLLFQLARQIRNSRVLLVGTFRPEDIAIGRGEVRHPLAPVLGELKRYYGDIVLDLDQSEAERRDFVWALVDAEPNLLDDRFREELLHHTSGQALFTVELLREMQERGDLQKEEDGLWYQRAGFAWEDLPSRVEGVIETRIGRLDPDDRQALHVGSVEGETFTSEVIAKVQKTDPREIIRRLSRDLASRHQLIVTEGVQQLGSQRISRYRFRHVLFQKYLYSVLDEAERFYLHEDVGTALEELYGERAPEISVQLSHHFTQSGNWEKAVHYLLIAGNQAHAASAYREAIDAYTQGLKVVKEIPADASRSLKELMLYLSLGNTLMTAKGAADKRVEEVFSKAIDLSRQVEDTPQSFVAIRGLSLHSKMRGEYDVSKVFEKQMLNMAENLQDPMLLTEAHRLIAESLVSEGTFDTGKEHYQQALSFYQSALHPKFTAVLGVDSGVIAQSQLAYFTWSLGYPERAISIGHEALKLARELDHPFSLAIALDTISALYHQLRDPQTCRNLAQECSNLSIEYGFSFWNARACMRRGWALAMLDHVNEGIDLIEEGLATYHALGSNISMPCMWTLHAEAQLIAGHYEDCCSTAEEALRTVERLNERYCEVETHRIRADCLAQQGDLAGAQSVYRHAIEVAQSQKAKSLELRARLHLMRLLIEEGDPEKEISNLEQLYRWFQEGFDTTDLKEVKAVLEEYHLSHHRGGEA